jgi:ABC-type transporter Mla subunit MlaD
MNILRQEIRTGLLVVVSIAVLVTLMLYLGSPGVFVPQKGFILYVDNASGLRQGAMVAIAGRKVGQVLTLYSPVPEAERPDPKKETKIEIKVARSAEIYRSVRCVLTSTGLLGEYFIDFTGGQEASGLAPEGTAFLVERAAGMEQAVPLVLQAIEPALKTATETMNSLQKTADNLTRLTSPGGEIELTVAEFRKFGSNLQLLSAPGGSLRLSLDNIAALTGPEGKLQLALGNVEKLTGDNGSLAQAMKNAEKFTSGLAANKDLDATLKNARQATAELHSTVAELKGKFSAVAGNLEQASDTVKRQPWRLVWPTTKKYEDQEKPERTPTPTPAKRKKSSRR